MTAYPSGNNTYYNSWSQASPPQPQTNSTEDRAAETLSALSARDQAAAAANANRAAPGQYAGYDSTYPTSVSASNQPTAQLRTTSIPSPVYQSAQPDRPSVLGSSYGGSGAQTYPANPAYPSYSYSGGAQSQQQQPTVNPQKSTRPGHSPATAYQRPATSTTRAYRPNSPYLAQQHQQARQTPPQQSRGREEESSTARSSTAAAAQMSARDARPANVGQPRAPSVTPRDVQQQANGAGGQYSDNRRPSAADTPAPTTVDPSQVYDPWPEQERRIREAEARHWAEQAAKAEREAEERKVEEAIKAKKDAQATEKKRLEAEGERQRKAAAAAQKQQSDEQNRAMLASAKGQASMDMDSFAPGQPNAPPPGSDLEIEMLAMFRKMREFNDKNPTMLARLWDQERRAHIANTISPSASPAHSAAMQAAQRLPPPVPSTSSASATATTTSTFKPQPSLAAPSRPPLTLAGPPNPLSTATDSTPSAATGSCSTQPLAGPATNTIWPPGKKLHLAEAAAKWLNSKFQNAGKHVTGEQVVSLLHANPSYLSLCESLERLGLFVDRAAFARALLSAVPDVNKTATGQSQNGSTQPMINKGSVAAAAAATTAPAQCPPASVTPVASPSSDPAKKKRGPNIGKFGSVRGRPKKDAAATQSKMTGQMEEGRQPEAPGASSGVVNLTSAPAGASSAGPSLVAMYHEALSGNTVEYQSDLGYTAPLGNDYYKPSAHPALQAPMTAPRSRPPFMHQEPRPYTSPYFDQSNNGQQAGVNRPGQSLPSRQPANKQEAARKRNFAELVDLTADGQDSDEDIEPAAKHPNLGQLTAGISTSPGLGLGNGYSASSLARPFNQYMYNGPLSNQSETAIAGPAPQARMQPGVVEFQPEPVPGFGPTMVSRELELKGRDLVERIQKKKVARKSQYDARTICRDVLLATGRHPEMRALNQHLFGMHEFLKSHSSGVEGDKFDLASVRWDLIDPGEPVVQKAPAEDEASEVATDANDEGDKVDKSSERGERVVQNRQTSDPAHRRKPFAKRRGQDRTPGSRTSMPSTSAKSRAVDDGGELSDQRRGSQPLNNTTTSTSVVVNVRSSRALLSPHPQASSFTPVNKASAMSGTPASAPVGYAAFNQLNTQLDENGKPIKRKGRPVGWRKSIHSKAAVAGVAGEVPAVSSLKKRPVPTPHSDQVKRRGRPPKQATMERSVREPSPRFNVFKCEWEGCNAELHNIDTLRKHILKLHGKETGEGDYECFWLDCFKDRSGIEDEPYIFAKVEDWLQHMETSHLKPLARMLGDGPRIGLSGS